MRGRILKDLSVENAMKHTRYLAQELPERFSGNSNEWKAAEYIEQALREAGIPVTMHEVKGYASLPVDSRLEVLAPEAFELPSIPFMNIPDTPPEGMEGELVDVGPGGEDDLDSKDVRGKIILAESSYSPPRQEKVRLATARGVIGVLVAHWGLEDPPLMVRGNAKAVWGNPSLETVEKMPKIPALGITKADLGRLRRLLSQGSVRVRVHGRVEKGWKKLPLPVGRIEGSGEHADQFIILGGHFDAWGEGATDNANGNGLILEVARVVHKYQKKLNRGLWICFWSGHETATMAASTWLVDQFWDELNDRCVAYFNVDSPGMKGTERYTIYTSPEMADFARGVAIEVLAEEPDVQRVARTGDQSFFGIGIPSMNSRTMFSPEEVRRMANATLGWWNHGYPCHDTMDKVDPQLMGKNMRGIAATAWEICTRPVIPMNFVPMVDEMEARLKELDEATGDLLNLSPLTEAARQLRSRAGRLETIRQELERLINSQKRRPGQKVRGQIGKMNGLLMRLSRLLIPAFASVAGRYGQDPYGLTNLKTRFPGLYYAPRLAALDRESEAYHLTLTSCTRERNRAADALREALSSLDVVLEGK